jgi:hypothetical protein
VKLSVIGLIRHAGRARTEALIESPQDQPQEVEMSEREDNLLEMFMPLACRPKSDEPTDPVTMPAVGSLDALARLLGR